MRSAVILALTFTLCSGVDVSPPTIDPVLNCAGYNRMVIGHFYNVLKERHDQEGLKTNPDIQEPWRLVSEEWRRQERFWTIKPSTASIVFGLCRLVRDDEIPTAWPDDNTIPIWVVSEVSKNKRVVLVGKSSTVVGLLDLRELRPLALVLTFQSGNDLPVFRGLIQPELLTTNAIIGMAVPLQNESQADWTARVLADDPSAFKPQ